jgi:CHAT domain-containing protein
VLHAAYRGERSGCGEFESLEFEPLPAASREIDEIAALWKKGIRDSGEGVVRLAGAEASEDAFKAQAPGKRLLHLATHGFFFEGRCPVLTQAPEGRGEGEGCAPPFPPDGENPLLLSGLALAGANQRHAAGDGEQDGILTAEEIAALNLTGVEWAVLSACDTGVGDARAGEGLLGLRRAFRVAGARTLITSLWAVEDEPGRRWMRGLYENRFVRGLRTVESVRAASLEVLDRRRREGESTHPFYWAGFVASGDWR